MATSKVRRRTDNVLGPLCDPGHHAGQDRGDTAAYKNPPPIVRHAEAIAAILKEVLTSVASTLLDTDAANKAADADLALQELGSDEIGEGYVTATVTAPLFARGRKQDLKSRALSCTCPGTSSLLVFSLQEVTAKLFADDFWKTIRNIVPGYGFLENAGHVGARRLLMLKFVAATRSPLGNFRRGLAQGRHQYRLRRALAMTRRARAPAGDG